MIPFDPNQLIPLIGMVGGMVVAGIVSVGVLQVGHRRGAGGADSRIARSRVRRSREVDAGYVAGVGAASCVDMQGQIAEMAERLDFTERLLAQKRERSLPGA